MSRRNPTVTACVAAFALLVAVAAACGGETGVAPDEAGGGETAGPTRAAGRGATYYVSNQGDDEAGGGQASTAFRTIDRALEAVRPGDTILIQPGTYHEALTLEEAGGPAPPITIRGGGSTPVLDGRGDMSIAFWCERCANITFENLEIRN